MRITSISLAYVCCSTNDIYSAARSPGVNPTDITFLLNVNRSDVRVPGLSDVARFPRAINSTAETRNIDDGFNSEGTLTETKRTLFSIFKYASTKLDVHYYKNIQYRRSFIKRREKIKCYKKI